MVSVALRVSRDIRVRRATVEALTVAMLVLFLVYLFARAREASSLNLDFLQERAGFGLGDQFLTDATGNDSRWALYVAGVMNTVRVTVFGILFSVAIGFVAGIARLSSNWLASKIAFVYVEAIRNTPLLVFVVFWYTAVVLRFPRIGESASLFDVVYASNRAIVIPWVRAAGDPGPWLVVLTVAFGVAAAVWWSLRRTEALNGKPAYPWRVSLGLFVGVTAIAFLLMGRPLALDVPSVGRFAYEGGMRLSPEFVGLLVALSLFNGAFIAEIVRGAIQSVPRGEREAAAALGLSSWQQMTQVVLPQAFRAMLPPLATQCQSLAKYSAVAVAIAFPDLLTVGGTIINNSGEAIPMFIVMMLTYLVLNLLIALAINGPQWRPLTRSRGLVRR